MNDANTEVPFAVPEAIVSVRGLSKVFALRRRWGEPLRQLRAVSDLNFD